MKRSLRFIITIVLALLVATSSYVGFAVWSTPQVKPTKGVISIAIAEQIFETGTLDKILLTQILPAGTNITIKFEPSGTHIKNDVLKVRFDIYFGEGSQTYLQQYVDHYVRDLTLEELADPELAKLVPTYKALNPALVIFAKVSPDVTVMDIRQQLASNFNWTLLSNLDYILAQSKTDLQLLSFALKGKFDTEVKTYDSVLVETINTRLAGLETKL